MTANEMLLDISVSQKKGTTNIYSKFNYIAQRSKLVFIYKYTKSFAKDKLYTGFNMSSVCKHNLVL